MQFFRHIVLTDIDLIFYVFILRPIRSSNRPQKFGFECTIRSVLFREYYLRKESTCRSASASMLTNLRLTSAYAKFDTLVVLIFLFILVLLAVVKKSVHNLLKERKIPLLGALWVIVTFSS